MFPARPVPSRAGGAGFFLFPLEGCDVIWDTVLFGSAEAEVNILECRLRELENVPDLHHVIVEAEITHRGDPKPWWYEEHHKRFEPWGDRITYIRVAADQLPSVEENPSHWSREKAQREFCRMGLDEADPNDIVLHGDCDEIPRPAALLATEDLPLLVSVFEMRLCMYAVDWLHPLPWHGTIRTRARSVGSFAHLRDLRNDLPVIVDGGSHLSWMGGPEVCRAKLATHCHTEMTSATEEALRSGEWLREGHHSDGHKLKAVDVDETWPRWVHEKQCPGSWFRSRGDEHGVG